MTQALRTTGAASDILWSMATGVIESVRDPELIDPGLLDSVMTLLRRAEYLGLLKSDAEHRPDESWSWLPAIVLGMRNADYRPAADGGSWTAPPTGSGSPTVTPETALAAIRRRSWPEHCSAR